MNRSEKIDKLKRIQKGEAGISILSPNSFKLFMMYEGQFYDEHRNPVSEQYYKSIKGNTILIKEIKTPEELEYISKCNYSKMSDETLREIANAKII